MSKELLSFQISKAEILLKAVSESILADAASNKIDSEKQSTAQKMEWYLSGLKDAYEIMFCGDIEPHESRDLVSMFGARTIDFMNLKFEISENSAILV